MSLGIPARILKDSSSYQMLVDMVRPELEKKIRAEVEKQIRDELEEEARVELEKQARIALEKQARIEWEKQIRVEQTRSLLIDLATDRFGNPTEAQKANLDGITDYDRLVRLCKKVGTLSTWDELLGSEPAA